MLIDHLYIIIGETAIQVFCPFWIRLFSVNGFWEFLICLAINPLLKTWFANIFSDSMGCLFTVDNALCTKFFDFYEFQLSIFSFAACAFGIIFKNHCQCQCHEDFPLFCSKSCIAFELKFKSLIHFELMFVYKIRDQFHFYFCMWISSFHNTIRWKDCSCPIKCPWLPCQKYLTMCARVYFWDIHSIPLVYLSDFMTEPHYFDYNSFVLSLEISKCEISNLLFFKIILAIQGSYEF